jgi:hypothetical protein
VRGDEGRYDLQLHIAARRNRHAPPRPTSKTKLGYHSFRATGIMAYLKNGGTLENAHDAAAANEVSLDEVERILI